MQFSRFGRGSTEPRVQAILEIRAILGRASGSIRGVFGALRPRNHRTSAGIRGPEGRPRVALRCPNRGSAKVPPNVARASPHEGAEARPRFRTVFHVLAFICTLRSILGRGSTRIGRLYPEARGIIGRSSPVPPPPPSPISPEPRLLFGCLQFHFFQSPFSLCPGSPK